MACARQYIDVVYLFIQIDYLQYLMTRLQPQPQPPPLRRCPGFCLLSIMAPLCERPSVVISRTSNCKSGSVCCDNSRNPSTLAGGGGGGGKPPGAQASPPETTTTPAPTTTQDPRPDCPGSCIVSYLSFTCFSKLFKLIYSRIILQ